MKILKKNVMMFLICTALPVSSGMILYSSDIKSVIIRNNRVKISLEKAKKIAFEHSKIYSSSAKLTRLVLEKENKKYIYEIVFYYKNKKYRYNVDANTGRIIDYSSHDNIVSYNELNNFYSIPVPVAPSAEITENTDDSVVASNSTNSHSEDLERRENSPNRANRKGIASPGKESYSLSRTKKDVETIILEQLEQNIPVDLENAIFEEIILVNAKKSIYKGIIKVNYLEYRFKINLSTGKILSWKEKIK